MCLIFHSWSEWKKNPRDSKHCILTQERECSDCGKVKIETWASCHDFVLWETVQQQGFSGGGIGNGFMLVVLNRTCKKCGFVESKINKTYF